MLGRGRPRKLPSWLLLTAPGLGERSVSRQHDGFCSGAAREGGIITLNKPHHTQVCILCSPTWGPLGVGASRWGFQSFSCPRLPSTGHGGEYPGTPSEGAHEEDSSITALCG